jgi:hemolysin activation/secretion protein
MVRFFGQLANARLTPSEQIGIGGAGTVRGYGERTANGDQGFTISNELRTPPIAFKQLMGFWPVEDRLQFLTFIDYGTVYINDFEASDVGAGLKEKTSLSSIGGGLRYSMYQNVTVRFDYGFQLMDREKDSHSGGHVSVLVSF